MNPQEHDREAMKKQDIREVLRLLRELYPDAKPELHFSNPYETLISVMLSAQSTDVQVNKVTPVLFQQYPDVRALAGASVEDVFPIVRSCGFKSKASNIVDASKLIVLRHNGQVPDTMEALTALPGVGRKTANVRAGQRVSCARNRGGHTRIPRQQPYRSGRR